MPIYDPGNGSPLATVPAANSGQIKNVFMSQDRCTPLAHCRPLVHAGTISMAKIHQSASKSMPVHCQILSS